MKRRNIMTRSDMKGWIRVAIIAVIICVMLVIADVLQAEQGRYLIPTIPGTGYADPTKSGWEIMKDGRMVPLLPGTTYPDPTRSGYKVQDGMLVPTIPGTDYQDTTKPSYRYEGGPMAPQYPSANYYHRLFGH